MVVTMPTQNLARPTGSLGTLYDEVTPYAKDPIAEIERIAQSALKKKYIDDKIYAVLSYRVPFHGIEREVLDTTGKRFEIGKERVRTIESDAYIRLRRYKLNEEDNKEPLSLGILYLPWDLVQSKGYRRAINSLNRLAKKFGREPTALGILELFEYLSTQEQRL